RRNGDQSRDPARRALSAREQALAVFEIEPPFTLVRLKARYKVLVKLHHPDAHGGDKAAEEKLKIINQAYATLKASYFA
ncbi:MAG: molecular chaperone DnaJ, partial [Alphaproteobacteria bacterium]